MTSFLSQAAMTNDLIRQKQREEEDRAFQLRKQQQEEEDRAGMLRKQQHELAELDQKAYLRPFEIKDLENQYKDAEKDRNKKLEQESLHKWIQPYQPKTALNPDGTRSLETSVPIEPAIAATILPGMAMMGPAGMDLSGFMKPFQDQTVLNNRTYNTPEEIAKKAQLEDDHKRRLELEGARNDGRVQLAQTRKTGGTGRAASGPAGAPRTPDGKPARYSDFDRAFEADLKRLSEYEEAAFARKNRNQLPTPEESIRIKAEVARKLLSDPMYRNVSPVVREAYLPGQTAAPAGPPAPQPGTGTKKADVRPEEIDEFLNQTAEINKRTQPATQSAGLDEKQGSAASFYDRFGPQPLSNDIAPPPQMDPVNNPAKTSEVANKSPYAEGTVADVVWKLGQMINRGGSKLPPPSSFDAFTPGTFSNKPGYHQ